MKNLAIHALIVLLALACFADAFKLQSKVKAKTKDDPNQLSPECEQCIYGCGWFIMPEPTDELVARQQCVNEVMYQDCCEDCSNVCSPGWCDGAIEAYCYFYGYI